MALAAYYNEHEPFAAQWLRNLISTKLIAAGEVDDRSIADVRPDDLRGFNQCHFFAGIGGWSYALRLAGWPDDRECWTGSCPCQPFSAAGRQEGKADTRHLWPVWFPLIRECRPPVIFGEQVASSIAFGWLDEVAHDVEAEAYAIASAVLPACSVGAPHRRDRLWFVANSGSVRGRSRPREDDQVKNRHGATCCGGAVADSMRVNRGWGIQRSTEGDGAPQVGPSGEHSRSCDGGTLADPHSERLEERQECDICALGPEQPASCRGDVGGRSEPLADAEGLRLEERIEPQTNRSQQPTAERSGILGNASNELVRERGNFGERMAEASEQEDSGTKDPLCRSVACPSGGSWILCGDGKRRPVEPSIRLLAHGVPARVGRLRGYGNAIVPQVAAEFIRAYMECRP